MSSLVLFNAKVLHAPVPVYVAPVNNAYEVKADVRAYDDKADEFAFAFNVVRISVEPTVKSEQVTLPLHEKLPDPLNDAILVVPP
jgi:hypothetical protein